MPVSRCLVVSNLPKTTKNMVHLYFENEKISGGGPIEKIEFEKDLDVCMVVFQTNGSK